MADRMHSLSRNSLLPAGHRWGRGAQSLVPYLANGRVQEPVREPGDEAGRINNPVFRDMEIRLVWRDH